MGKRLLFVIAVLALFCAQEVKGQSDTKRILILSLDTTQFYSDAFPVDSLVKFYQTDTMGIPRLYGTVLQMNINRYEHDDHILYSVPRPYVDTVRMSMNYRSLTNRLGDEYLGIVPKSEDQSAFLKFIEITRADYVLSLNLYEVLALNDEPEFGDSVRHVIHFDLFDKNLQVVNAGRYDTDTDVYELYDLSWFYKDFALDQIFWIKAHEKDPENMQSAYYQEIENYYKRGTSLEDLKMFGVNLGTGMAYGGIGFTVGKIFSENWEWNIGAGFDFSGMKVGIGFKNYPLGAYGLGPRPFVGLNYSIATGNKFEMGGERDEFGNQLYPGDVTTFRILSDQAIHLSFGFNILVDSGVAINPSVGYSFAFKRQDPEILSGPDKTGRTNFVQFMAVGGFEAGVIVTFYTN